MVAAQFGESGLVAEVVALHVSDRDGENLALAASVGEGSVGIFHPQVDRFADKLEARIPSERSGQ